MNKVPFALRMFGGSWYTIRALAEKLAIEHGIEDPQPIMFRYEGWGLMGFPPRIACNVKYISGDSITDLGRVKG